MVQTLGSVQGSGIPGLQSPSWHVPPTKAVADSSCMQDPPHCYPLCFFRSYEQTPALLPGSRTQASAVHGLPSSHSACVVQQFGIGVLLQIPSLPHLSFVHGLKSLHCLSLGFEGSHISQPSIVSCRQTCIWRSQMSRVQTSASSQSNRALGFGVIHILGRQGSMHVIKSGSHGNLRLHGDSQILHVVQSASLRHANADGGGTPA